MDHSSGILEEPKSKSHNYAIKVDDRLNARKNILENGLAEVEGHNGDICHVESSCKDVVEMLAQESGGDCDRAVSNGEIFSPDLSENVVTVISSQVKLEDVKNKDDHGSCDDYDTHSDSIETLEEDSPHDDSQDKICDTMLQQIRLTNNSAGGKAQDAKHGKEYLATGGDRLGDDNTSTDSHEVITDTGPPVGTAPTRPESLSLPRSLQYIERHCSTSDREESSASLTQPSSKAEGCRHQRTRSEAIDIQGMRIRGDLGYGDDVMSRSLPHGTIMRKGDLIEFVADDLQEKIKRSSPMSRTDSGSISSRRSSERSIASTSSATSASTSMATSSGLSRSPSSLLTQSPDAAPPIDPAAIIELEMNARKVADSVDLMMGNIRSNLHKMSAITVGCLEAYKTSVDITCDSVDSSIKSMYALMAKCEELSKTMEPVHQIGAQIKEIKRILDLFEAQLSEKS